MKVEITYPAVDKRKPQRRDFINWGKWPFLLALYACPIINICVGGMAWSVIAVWSLWMLWTSVFSTAMIEYNRISQVIKLIFNTVILLILIDLILTPGQVMGAVPIVCFGGLLVAGVLFFTDLDRQKQNMLPMLMMIASSIVSSVVVLSWFKQEGWWTIVVLGSLALALLFACIFVLRGDFLREFKKRFHTR